ncbi:MAG: thymidylate kinase [candidate division FCPU426 bacterium]
MNTVTHRCFYKAPPGVDPSALKGLLIVIEGMDSSGRSTQIERLTDWLERKGHSVSQVKLRRSVLVGEALERAKQGNILNPRTLSLFYATDFYDQLENVIVPAMRAGSIVLADRYIFTLMARDSVRGADPAWLESLYSMAVVPNAVVFLQASWKILVARTLKSRQGLDYWESGMDLGLSRDWFESFIRYQKKMALEFKRLQLKYQFQLINANRSIPRVERELRAAVEQVLGRYYPNVGGGAGNDMDRS